MSALARNLHLKPWPGGLRGPGSHEVMEKLGGIERKGTVESGR
jgi:hypothetical protein